MVRTSGFHPDNMGSIPVGDDKKNTQTFRRHFSMPFFYAQNTFQIFPGTKKIPCGKHRGKNIGSHSHFEFLHELGPQRLAVIIFKAKVFGLVKILQSLLIFVQIEVRHSPAVIDMG